MSDKNQCVKGLGCGATCISNAKSCVSEQNQQTSALGNSITNLIIAESEPSAQVDTKRLEELAKKHLEAYSNYQTYREVRDQIYSEVEAMYQRAGLDLNKFSAYEKSDIIGAVLLNSDKNKSGHNEVGEITSIGEISRVYSDKGQKNFANLNAEGEQTLSNSPLYRYVKGNAKKVIDDVASKLGIDSDTAFFAVKALWGHTTDSITASITTKGFAIRANKQSEAVKALFEKADKYRGKIYRSISSDDPRVLDFKPGETIKNNSLASWSSSEKFARSWRAANPAKQVVFVAENKTGVAAKALASSSYKEQEEVMSRPGAVYTVKNVSVEKSGLRVVELEEQYDD